MPTVDVVLGLPSAELLRFYAGEATEVLARATDGRRIRFPVSVLRPYVTEEGVYGLFRLQFDQRNRFVSIRPVSPR